jgi:glycosyltransferase involved in cell wall biosynthesis
MDKNDISVIIPTFNRLWCLPQAIESCRNNKFKTEIIVVDDGSTDGTWDWLQTVADITPIKQPNWGKCWAVNVGLAHSKGEYVRFLDSDDWLNPSINDEQLIIARKAQSDLVVAGYQILNEKTNEIINKPWESCDDFIAQNLGECDSSHYSAFLFRKGFIKNIPHRPDYAFRDDRLFIIEVAIAIPNVSVCDKLAFVHRHHTKNRLQFPSGTRQIETNAQHLRIYKKASELLISNNKLTQRRKNAIAKSLWPLAHWIARTHINEACETVDWIYSLNPAFEPSEKGVLGTLYRKLGFKFTEKILALRRKIYAFFQKLIFENIYIIIVWFLKCKDDKKNAE